LVLEIIAVLASIGATIGFGGLADSSPGPSREGLALAILVQSIVFVVLRANFAWRRSRDAGDLKWVLGSYIVFSAIFAILQAATFLVYRFGGDNSNLGLNMLGLAITVLWLRILLAKPVGGDWDAAAFAEQVAAELRGPQGKAERPSASAPPTPTGRPSRPSSPSAVAASRPRPASGRGGGFGKRGLA
jgi:hypothetical protein